MLAERLTGMDLAQIAPNPVQDLSTCHYLSGRIGLMAPTSDRWRRLAEHVTARRTQLGLTQGQVQAAGGPSVATMRLVEGALQDGYRGSILGRLERALAWEPGSIDAIFEGGEPTLAHNAGRPTVESHWEQKLTEVEAIANNPDRSPGLRAWARAQMTQIQDIIDAARAEEEAQRRHAS